MNEKELTQELRKQMMDMTRDQQVEHLMKTVIDLYALRLSISAQFGRALQKLIENNVPII
jgi:hypothetical protein